MAKLEPIEIKIDQDAVRAQIHEAITKALEAAAFKLRFAADQLDPLFLDEQEKFIEEQIEKEVAKRVGNTNA